MVAYRNLASETGPHFTEEEVEGARRRISPSPIPTVEGGERPGRPSDYFPPAPPYPGRDIRPTFR